MFSLLKRYPNFELRDYFCFGHTKEIRNKMRGRDFTMVTPVEEKERKKKDRGRKREKCHMSLKN